ncbi:metallophosphoesterase family protein [Chamaesiphon minutus]|uniref:Putative phosphohydrolase n=1 Tax=Chamaesiphon minutus (strain ATCC 27169 / PCC 6605) TaxID=1173020 RepID=K9UMG5_CHAP6|nr:metallophosphoesterase [Chamaesiphon minutus]AFY95384.1 putative phosphohydrolase [Chamaesiphon minutus PCC 6605]
MSNNRREFIIGAGLAGFGLAVSGKLLTERFNNTNDGANAAQEDRPAVADDNSRLAVALPKSKLLQRFAVMADTGSSTKNQYAVGRALSQYHQQNPFQAVLMVGDNIYNNGEMSKIKEAFEIPYADLLKRGVKFYAALGNHDVRTDNGDRQVEYPLFNMQGQYYTHTHGDVKFFVLETNAIVNPASTERAKQLAWLDRELAASKARWNIVYGHHNIYSAGVYKVDAIMQRDITPILKKHKVKLWINGHDHNYQRSQPIDGTTYLVCGGGGATLYPVKAQSWTAFAQSIHSFGIIEVYQDQLLLTGIDSQGQIIDRGLINLA